MSNNFYARFPRPLPEVPTPNRWITISTSGAAVVWSTEEQALDHAAVVGTARILPAFDATALEVDLHVGKGYRTLRGYPDKWELEGIPDAPDDLMSWAAWRALLSRPGVWIHDESDRVIDVAEFIALWDESAEHGRRSYERMMRWYDQNPRYATSRHTDDIIDDAGYHLTTREFS